MDTNNEQLRKCDTCKIIKPKSLFYRYKYCKKCYYKDSIKKYLSEIRTAYQLNISIDELKNIMTNNINDPTRNAIGEHDRYDEIMGYYMSGSSIITNDIINNFLDE